MLANLAYSILMLVMIYDHLPCLSFSIIRTTQTSQLSHLTASTSMTPGTPVLYLHGFWSNDQVD